MNSRKLIIAVATLALLAGGATDADVASVMMARMRAFGTLPK